MPTVQDILAAKGTEVMSIGQDATVLDAALLMNEHKIGCLVVTNGGVEGIFTERDILRRIVAERRDPARTRVGEVMTREVVCCGPETTLDDAAAIFRQKRIRHLPICGERGQLVGLISIGDLNAARASTQEVTIQHLHDYIYGRV